jgi:hypothetical protein
MVRYTIKLTKSEVEELESLVKKGSHKSQNYQAAYILLNTDEGDYSRKVTNERIPTIALLFCFTRQMCIN